MNSLIPKLKALVFANNGFARIVLIVTVAIGIGYIWQVNTSATAGYMLRDLEREIASLEHEYARAKLEVSRLQSVESVTTRMQMLGLVRLDHVNYVTTGDSAVAFDR